jgi:hypothetical protein
LAGYRERMFAIFPNVSILNILDQSGKYAFTGSSMALTVSFMKPILIIIPPLFLAFRCFLLSMT